MRSRRSSDRTGAGIALAALAVALARGAAAQTSAPGASDPVAAAADAAAAKLLAGKHVPGVAIGVASGGRVIFERGYGYADVAKRIPVSADTRFEIGSITKQFTAACILQLVEAGKLSLDDRLGTFVSEYFVGRGVTVRQLLDQESGIPEFLDGPDVVAAAGTEPATFATLLARVSGEPLEFAPGTMWKYSNTNYVLLGRIVEVVAHEPYERYVRAHLFGPAGMTQSGFIGDEATMTDVARGYVPTGNGATLAPPLRDEWAGAAGGIVSTVGDVLKWDAALQAGTIVKPADLALMRTSEKTVGGTDTHYGFGTIVDATGDHPRVWHNGGTFGFHAVDVTYPKDDESIVVLANAASNVERPAFGLFAATHPDVAAPAAAASGENPSVTARVREWLRRFETGDIDRPQLSAAMTKLATPDFALRTKAQLAPLGDPESLVFRGATPAAGGGTQYRYTATFAAGAFDIVMTIDGAGKISGYVIGAA